MTAREAYNRGWAAQARVGDWDEAEERFARRYCWHAVNVFCALEHAWSDGWSDRQAGQRKGHALRCPKGITGASNPDGHEACNLETVS